MVRRTRKQRGGLFGNLAQRAASAYVNNVALPVTKYAVKQAVKRSGLENTPELQAAKSMFRDVRAAYQSPQGQAMKAQLFQAATSPQAQALMTQARQAVTSPQAQAAAAGLLGMAAPQLANVYSPSAGPMPAQAPVAAPAAQPPSVSAQDLPFVLGIVGLLLKAQDMPKNMDGTILNLVEEAKRFVKNKERHKAMLDGLRSLASDVAALKGTPMVYNRDQMRSRGFVPGKSGFDTLELLTNPEVRSAVAYYLATTKEGKPGDQRFLSSDINSFTAALMNAFQRAVLLGGRTRRRRARRATRRSP